MPPTIPSILELDSRTTKARDIISTYLDQTFHTANSLLRRNFADDVPTKPLISDSSITLVSRAEATANPGKLTVSPFAIPNKAVFALFGLIGAGFVLTGIWFFFHAKNGGFYFTDHDFDDFKSSVKSSVLRRKGPNGTTLSGATESTDLGGGSVYKDVESTVDGSEMSELTEKKHRRKSRKTRIRGGDLEEGHGHDEDVRAYRHEKPARVGGINREPDSTAWEGSDARTDLLSNRQTTPTSSPTKSSSRRERRGGGIRKVSSSASTFWTKSQRTGRSSSERAKKREKEREEQREQEREQEREKEREKERERIKEEARKLQEKGRAASSRDGSSRRDFSYVEGDDASTVVSELERREERRARRERRRESSTKRDRGQRLLPQQEESDGDLGTKSYAHFIPGLSTGTPSTGTQTVSAPSEAGTYVDERRKKRAGGYRRGRNEDY